MTTLAGATGTDRYYRSESETDRASPVRKRTIKK
jgi:hypothetical protein